MAPRIHCVPLSTIICHRLSPALLYELANTGGVGYLGQLEAAQRKWSNLLAGRDGCAESSH
jgi:hypothetical protein